MDLTKFQVQEVIQESPHLKQITLKGLYEGKLIILRLEKTKFNPTHVIETLAKKKTIVERNFQNDIYEVCTVKSVDLSNESNATIITNPSESILAKYRTGKSTFVVETSKVYENLVRPYIKDLKQKEDQRDNWIYNILDGKSETDRVLFEDRDPAVGFMLVNNLNWGGDPDDLHAIALSIRRDITCIRDLGSKEVPLLMNILDRGTRAIKDKFPSLKYPIRAYIHYQPTFYHFHVHFRVQNPQDYLTTDRDNPLEMVIDNIKIFDNYYQKATMYYELSEKNPLFGILDKNSVFSDTLRGDE